MHWLVAFWIVCAIAVAVHVMAMALASRLAGLRIGLISIGIGPKISFPVGQTVNFAIGPLPIAGVVQFTNDGSGLDKTFAGLDPWQRIAVSAAGIVALMAVSFTGLGGLAIDAALSFWPQFLGIFLDLFGKSAQRFTEISVIFSDAPFLLGLPLVCAKLAAFNLAPFAGSNGMMMLESFLEAMRGEPVPEDAKQSYYQISLLVIFISLAFWLVGLGGWIWESI